MRIRATHVSLAAALVALLAPGCILQPTETPDCSAVGTSSCDGCTDQAGCGWCGSSGSCVPGSSFGPDGDVDCISHTWRYQTCTGPEGTLGCGRNETCNSCLYQLGEEDPDCAWCPLRGECIEPEETCVTGTVLRDYDMCSTANCSAQTTCSGCRAADCDWCDQSGGVCTNNGIDCDPHYRYWSSDDICPPPNDCSRQLGCDSCIAQVGCGWCDSIVGFGNCVAVNGSGGDYADWCNSDRTYTAARGCDF